MNIKRMMKEVEKIKKECPETCIGGPKNKDDIYNWDLILFGPTDTPYEGGNFRMSVVFPKNYPYSPPVIKFETKIYHPNIDEEGNICIDILSEKWSAALTIPKTIMSISSMLMDPNPDDPYRSDVAEEYINKRATFLKNAREHTKKYAMATTGN